MVLLAASLWWYSSRSSDWAWITRKFSLQMVGAGQNDRKAILLPLKLLLLLQTIFEPDAAANNDAEISPDSDLDSNKYDSSWCFS
jgi:hypothetical protein